VLLIFSALWRRALPEGHSLAGFNSFQMVWYLLITESITLARPRIESVITEDVKSGNIAYQLIRPYTYTSYHLAKATGEFLIRWPINLILGGVCASSLVGLPSLSWVAIPFVLVTSILGTAMNFLFTISLALTAFWLEENRPFFWIYSKMIFTLGGLFVPTEVYPSTLRSLAVWSPFQYMISAPARLFVRFDWAFCGQTLAGQFIWTTLLGLVVWVTYKLGVKKINVHGG
jgi:ABC-2 type transport system permease protein